MAAPSRKSLRRHDDTACSALQASAPPAAHARRRDPVPGIASRSRARRALPTWAPVGTAARRYRYIPDGTPRIPTSDRPMMLPETKFTSWATALPGLLAMRSRSSAIAMPMSPALPGTRSCPQPGADAGYAHNCGSNCKSCARPLPHAAPAARGPSSQD